MKTKIFILLAVSFILAILATGLWITKKEPAQRIEAPILPFAEKTNEATTTPTEPITKNIIYTKDGFNPAVTNIKPGDSIVFKNQNSKTLDLVMSDATSATIAKGKNFEMVFSEVGTLSLSDKWNPQVFGVVIVR